MRDNRVRQLASIDAIARIYKHRPLFIFKTDGAKVAYVFGKRVYKSNHWYVDHPQPFREAYKRYHREAEEILREPTPQELYGMLPAFHPLERPGGGKLTVGEIKDFATRAWHAKQVSQIVRLVQQAEAQYMREDLNDLSEVNRLEVIDDNGRAYVIGAIYNRPFNKVDLSYQDGGKTLKVFVEGLDKPDLL